jgi:iron-sulfur cluster repair protein YtfE (RIC family)
MLRDKSLIPLSHQHQHSLALCVRLSRAVQAGPVDLPAWQAEIAQQFQQETSIHFAAEEKEVFPQAERFPEIHPLVRELRAEHAALRELFARAADRSLDRVTLTELGEQLAAHIRKEERQLFEAMQKHMGREELEAMGAALERALAEASQACAVPGQRPHPSRTECD